MVGKLLSGRYEILEIIGIGGMANVYKARCTYLNRYVAIKVLKDEFKNDEEFLKRFYIESQAAACLSHTNIVSVYDVGSEGDIHYIVMEFVEGVTLKEYLAENGVLPWEKAVDFALQIASALQHAHRKNIVHRDIKPQNIIVTKDDVLKVTDFGIARAVSTFTMKVEDSAMGSVHYCSPEQARGGYTDEKSDVYSLGIVMYEMLTGKLPFESDNSVSVALKHMQEEAVAPSQIVDTIPSGVEDIVLKAMQKNQSERFQSAGEMLIELSWAKQLEGDKAEKKIQEERFKTKKIDVDAVKEEMNKKPDKPKKKVKTPKSSKQKKEDALAVLAGIGSAIVVVGLILLGVLALTGVFSGDRTSKDQKVPDLVGVDFISAKQTYSDFEIVVSSEEFSDKYPDGTIIKQTPAAGTKIKSSYAITVVVSKGTEIVEVPDVLKKDYRDAQILLDEKGILYSIEFKHDSSYPVETVIETNPSAGHKVTVGEDIVKIVVSAGEEENLPTLPDLVGMNEDAAKRKLTSLNLNSRVVYEVTDNENEIGKVIKQSIEPKTIVAEKTTITLTVGKVEDESPSGNEDGGTGKVTTKDITVIFPTDIIENKEQIEVKITANGKVVYQRIHDVSEEYVSVPVKGSGSVEIISYVDGVEVGSRTEEF